MLRKREFTVKGYERDDSGYAYDLIYCRGYMSASAESVLRRARRDESMSRGVNVIFVYDGSPLEGPCVIHTQKVGKHWERM